MKKHSNILKNIIIVILLLPLVASWVPDQWIFNEVKEQKERMVPATDDKGNPVFEADGVTPKFEKIFDEVKSLNSAIPESLFASENRSDKETHEAYVAFLKYLKEFMNSFRKLSMILAATLICSMILSVLLGYLSVLSMKAGRGFSGILSAFESIPSIIIALFCYVPVSGVLSNQRASDASLVSLLVFVGAATVTVLPEAVRSISIPLADLYDRKYSVSFRSYGFTKNRILSVLMKTSLMKDTLKRVAAGILLKTLVLDTSFGYVVQLGFGEAGSTQHTSPGSLIAAYRSAIFGASRYPAYQFWIPALIVIGISVAFLLILGNKKEEA